MNYEGLQAMSKKLEKRATRLVRKAEYRAMVIRRVVREYREVQIGAGNNPANKLERQLDIERAVGKYNQVHKALKRVRRKIQLKRGTPEALRPNARLAVKRHA
ncbi:MAG TPA: hypothetical protein VLM38_24180 [Blastocatellia bacterium]|nr:hypothetical protein [Blastocatellia bacterium]